jgi:hypothetical protein
MLRWLSFLENVCTPAVLSAVVLWVIYLLTTMSAVFLQPIYLITMFQHVTDFYSELSWCFLFSYLVGIVEGYGIGVMSVSCCIGLNQKLPVSVGRECGCFSI